MPGWNWRQATGVPTSDTLHAVCAGRAGAYAVGENGTVLHRDGSAWKRVLHEGPSGNGHVLRGADTTDDGRALWVVGGSGTVGVHDTEEESTAALTIPNEEGNFTAVAVAGERDDARVWIADDSGGVHQSAPGPAGEREWETTQPAGGTAVTSANVTGDGRVVVTDADGGAHERTGDGEWSRLGVAAADPLHCSVEANGGLWFGSDDAVYVPDGDGWRVAPVAEDSVTGIAGAEDVVLGVTDDGAAVAHADGTWETLELPVDEPFYDVAFGERFVAVGASGTILEAE